MKLLLPSISMLLIVGQAVAKGYQDCRPDIAKFCTQEQVYAPDGLEKCLGPKRQELSEACRVFYDASSRANKNRRLEACNIDAARLCAHIKRPDPKRISRRFHERKINACLAEHETELSPDCRGNLQTAAKNPELSAAKRMACQNMARDATEASLRICFRGNKPAGRCEKANKTIAGFNMGVCQKQARFDKPHEKWCFKQEMARYDKIEEECKSKVVADGNAPDEDLQHCEDQAATARYTARIGCIGISEAESEKLYGKPGADN